MLFATLRRRAWYLAGVCAISLVGFLALSTGLSAPASATGSSVAPADHLSTVIATLPTRSTAVASSAVVTVATAGCATDQLTALAAEDCR